MRRFTTAPIDRRHRLDFWRTMVAEAYVPHEVTDWVGDDFHADIATTAIGGLVVTRARHFSQAVRRPRSLVRSHDFDGFLIGMPTDCVLRFSHNGHDAAPPPGSVYLQDFERAYASRVDGMPGPHQPNGSPSAGSLSVLVARETMTRVLPSIASAAGLSIAPDQATAALIIDFFRNLMEAGHRLAPSSASRIETIGLDLLAAGFAERLACEPRQRASAAMLFYRASLFIDEHLSVVELDTEMIAAALQVSVRRLQQVFAEHELTVDGHLWERRLLRAARQLVDPAFAGLLIASIAYRAGFVSLPHFTRRFRVRYGMTPTDFRACHRDGAFFPDATAPA